MKKKMQNLLITAALWTLKKCHYQIPVIRPNIISKEFAKRAIVEQKMPYYQIQEWLNCSNIDLNAECKRKVREAMAERLAGDLEVFTLHTPDGIIYRADIVYCDMAPFEKTLNNYEE